MASIIAIGCDFVRVPAVLRAALPAFALFAVSSTAAVGHRPDAAPASVAVGRPAPALTSVRDVRALTTEEAKARRTVRLRGTVTVLSGWKSSFFLQDGTAGISVDRLTDAPALAPGQSVEIHGVTGAGLFAPIVIADAVTSLGKGALPAARVFSLSELTSGKEDSQYLAIRGIVRSAVAKPSWGRSVLFLNIDIGGGSLVTARVHDFSPDRLAALPAATVTVRGVCGTVFNDKRQFIGIRLFVASLDDVTIERPAPAEPFDLPVRPLNSLLQFGDQDGAINRVKVRGIVTWAKPGEGLYIQDGAQGVYIQSGQTTPVPVGSQLEAVGYPTTGRYSPKLDNAVFRVTGPTLTVTPIVKTASDMIVTNEGFAAAPFDSVLVQIKAKLIEEVPGAGEDLLIFQDGTTVFTARLPRTSQKAQRLATGSTLAIAGVCAANADDAHEAHSFEMLLRSPADLEVVEPAPWWTPTHAAWVVAILALVLLVMFGWLAAVRRQGALRALAVADALTGLYNRRGFLLLAEQQWQLALRNNVTMLLFYIDVDRFKEINDTLGHREGDAALRAVADALRECFRKVDILGRIGGDEFAVVAIDANASSRSLLERRLTSIVEHGNQRSGRLFQLSLSVGVLTCESLLGPISIEELISRADALMYQQKRKRRTQSRQRLQKPEVSDANTQN